MWYLPHWIALFFCDTTIFNGILLGSVTMLGSIPCPTAPVAALFMTFSFIPVGSYSGWPILKHNRAIYSLRRQTNVATIFDQCHYVCIAMTSADIDRSHQHDFTLLLCNSCWFFPS
jgi:hypothetical protein